jgi:GNAT superfamily N-acetyltransferase
MLYSMTTIQHAPELDATPASRTARGGRSVTVGRLSSEQWLALRDVWFRLSNKAPDGREEDRLEDRFRGDRAWANLVREHVWFVATVDREPVAMVSVALPAATGDACARLTSIRFTTPLRCHGIGRRLIECVREWAVEQEFEALTLEVANSDLWERPLFESLGFTPNGDRVASGDFGCNLVEMRLDLAS